MDNELLFEIGTEEIPAGFIMPALSNLCSMLEDGLRDLHLSFGEIRSGATPRRLTVSISDLAARQPDRREEILGPPVKAAFDGEGNPTKAALGFARTRGVAPEDLTVVSTPRGEYVMLTSTVSGQDTASLLATLLPDLVHGLPFPKSMRWGDGQGPFARPIHWFLALYNGKVIPFVTADITSGSKTRGHRFTSSDPFEVGDFDDYIAKLKERHVLVDPAARRKVVVEEAERLARSVGGHLLPDDELVDTVTNLVEFPHGVCGVFEDRFLDLPDAVLITSMREHQKYFCIVDQNRRLLPYFVAINNTPVEDPAMAAAGHQRVLRARLEDALFFFKEDRNRTLADRAVDLSGLIFQAGLGTMKEKTERISQLAANLADKLAPSRASETVRAAQLAKADLLTAMVNEFPSLQGVIGREYALLDGEKEAVATAILEHYLPVRAGDQPPGEIPGAVVSLSDRLDSIAGSFGLGRVPSGTADPFGLRRLTLGLLRIIEAHAFSFSLAEVIEQALTLYGDRLTVESAEAQRQIIDFIRGRFVNDQVGRGLPAETVEAVTSVSFDDVMDCLARIEALEKIRRQPAFEVLAGTFKRVMNIIKDHQAAAPEEKLLVEPAEQNLYRALLSVRDASLPLLEKNDYVGALEVMLRMKEPADDFFDQVMVMVEEPALRANRLNLLTAIARLFLEVGDFSKMQGIAGTTS